MIQLREGQQLTGTGMLATMAPGMAYAIAAKRAFSRRFRQTLQSPRAALLEAVVDANEKPSLPEEPKV